MALNAQILLSILAHESSSGDISQTLRATPASYSLTLGNGTGANQAQVAWSDSRTIGAGADDQLFVKSLADDRGNVDFSAIKLIYIKNTGAVLLTINGGDPLPWAAGPFGLDAGSSVSVPAGGVLMLTNASAAGWAVSGALEQISFSNTSETVAGTYEIILIGEGTVT